MQKITTAMNGLALVLICLYIAVAIPAFTPGYYSHAYDKYNIPQTISIEKNELMRVTTHMLRYLKDKEESLYITATVNKQVRPFFSEREIEHMVDVKNLFQGGAALNAISVVIFALTLAILWKQKKLRMLAKVYQWIPLGVAALLAVGAALVSINFEQAFIFFHKISFTNDLWLLDPHKDLLINIVPEPFFVDISIAIALLFTGMMLIISILATIYRRYNPCKSF